jgi:hypothetical protein
MKSSKFYTSLEDMNMINKLRKRGIVVDSEENLNYVETSENSSLNYIKWGILDMRNKIAYLPTAEYLERIAGYTTDLPYYEETYNSIRKILKEKGYDLMYYDI